MWPRLHKTQNQICSPFRKSVCIKHRIKYNGSGSSHDLKKKRFWSKSKIKSATSLQIVAATAVLLPTGKLKEKSRPQAFPPAALAHFPLRETSCHGHPLRPSSPMSGASASLLDKAVVGVGARPARRRPRRQRSLGGGEKGLQSQEIPAGDYAGDVPGRRGLAPAAWSLTVALPPGQSLLLPVRYREPEIIRRALVFGMYEAELPMRKLLRGAGKAALGSAEAARRGMGVGRTTTRNQSALFSSRRAGRGELHECVGRGTAGQPTPSVGWN
jgi:hypothetical protein